MQTQRKLTETQSAGGVVINKNGEVLIVKQSDETWSLPKGHLEKGENELDAARREIFEESGLQELTLIKFLGKYTREKFKSRRYPSGELKLISFYLFSTSEILLNPVDLENPMALWVKPTLVTEFLSYKEDKEFFSKIIASTVII